VGLGIAAEEPLLQIRTGSAGDATHRVACHFAETHEVL